MFRCYELADQLKTVSGTVLKISTLYKSSIKNTYNLFNKYQFELTPERSKVD